MKSKTEQNRLMMLGSLASIGTAVILILAKGIAFFFTGSVAILSSLFDSAQDFMTSLINWIAVKQAVQPADKAHRFGHGKAQGIGALLQGFIIAASAVLLLVESISHLLKAVPIQRTGIGVIVTLFGIVLTFGLVHFQNYVVTHTQSLSIKTDRAHYTGDILMNVGVLVSLGASGYLGWTWTDGIFGIGIALYLCWVVVGIMHEACNMLMDKELPQLVRNEIRQIALHVPLVKNVSSLRTRAGGAHWFIQFNAQFNGKLSLEAAHTALDEIEKRLLEKYPDAEVIIHAEPFDKTKKGK